MLPRKPFSFGPVSFLVSLMGLAMLPLAPELWLFLSQHGDLKYIIPIWYYEGIISLALVTPALFLRQRWSQSWILVVGVTLCTATLIVGFQAASAGARWDLTAHTALMQTNPSEAWGFLCSFDSLGPIAFIGVLGTCFATCIAINLRSAAPSRRSAWVWLFAGALVSFHGVRNFVRYGGNPIASISVGDEMPMEIAGCGTNSFHPVSLLVLTHVTYRGTRNYYMRAFQNVEAQSHRLKGATPLPEAVGPRILIVVIGESANRRHWSLYGYPRSTNPRLETIKSELAVFRDVISTSVGTTFALRRMWSIAHDSLPIFPLFSAAGFRTHWLSAQFNQGSLDLEVVALTQSCDRRVFLNGAYDENLVPLVQQAAAEPGRHLIFVNLFGSHVRYDDRYPRKFAVFRGQGEKEHRIAAYDNSIRYTDHVLVEMIQLLRARAEPSCLLYLSDHGEDVYDSAPDRYLFRSDSLSTDPMYEVPFFIWFSPQYRDGNPDFVRTVRAAGNKKATSDGLYHGVIELARLSHPTFDPRASLFSTTYAVSERRVGVGPRNYDSRSKAP